MRSHFPHPNPLGGSRKREEGRAVGTRLSGLVLSSSDGQTFFQETHKRNDRNSAAHQKIVFLAHLTKTKNNPPQNGHSFDSFTLDIYWVGCCHFFWPSKGKRGQSPRLGGQVLHHVKPLAAYQLKTTWTAEIGGDRVARMAASLGT